MYEKMDSMHYYIIIIAALVLFTVIIPLINNLTQRGGSYD